MFERGDAGVSVLGVTVSADTIYAGAGIDNGFSRWKLLKWWYCEGY